MKRLKIKVIGDVQGVFFRYNAEQMAHQLGLKGWVTNADNGDVLVVVEGKKESVQKFIEWCKVGPDMATVEEVQVEEDDSTEIFTDFKGR